MSQLNFLSFIKIKTFGTSYLCYAVISISYILQFLIDQVVGLGINGVEVRKELICWYGFEFFLLKISWFSWCSKTDRISPDKRSSWSWWFLNLIFRSDHFNIDSISHSANRSFIFVYSLFRIFLFGGSVHKDSSFLLAWITDSHIFRYWLIEFFILVTLYSVKFLQFGKNFNDDLLWTGLIMSAFVYWYFLKFWSYVVNNELTLVCRDNFIFLTINKKNWDFKFYLVVKCNSEGVVFLADWFF